MDLLFDYSGLKNNTTKVLLRVVAFTVELFSSEVASSGVRVIFQSAFGNRSLSSWHKHHISNMRMNQMLEWKPLNSLK
jgi:hypothetical protein